MNPFYSVSGIIEIPKTFSEKFRSIVLPLDYL